MNKNRLILMADGLRYFASGLNRIAASIDPRTTFSSPPKLPPPTN